MWPFKRKRQEMTVDVAAEIFADSIRKELEQYTIAVDRFAITHNVDEELKQIMDELWIFNITILDYVWSIIDFPENIRDKIIPMIITGYSRIDHHHYIKMSHVYGNRISSSSQENIPITMGETLSEIIGSNFHGFKDENGHKMLAGTAAQLMLKTMDQLSNLTFNTQKKYNIIL